MLGITGTIRWSYEYDFTLQVILYLIVLIIQKLTLLIYYGSLLISLTN